MVVVIKNEAQNQTHSTVPRSCDLDLVLKSYDFLNLRHTFDTPYRTMPTVSRKLKVGFKNGLQIRVFRPRKR